MIKNQNSNAPADAFGFSGQSRQYRRTAGDVRDGRLYGASRHNHRGPDLPPGCEKLSPPEDNKVVAHVFAVGVQIYRWDGSGLGFVAPLRHPLR